MLAYLGMQTRRLQNDIILCLYIIITFVEVNYILNPIGKGAIPMDSLFGFLLLTVSATVVIGIEETVPHDIYTPGSHDLIFTKEQKQALRTRSAYLNVTKWPNGVVPYTMTNAFRNKATQQKVLTRVISEYAKQTCIRLVPRTTETNYIEFDDYGGCSSHFGMIGGKQVLALDDDCVRFNYGTAMHEIMHSLGFMHEQMRPDRDYYVDILWQNIPESGKDQFIIVPYKDTDLLGAYDYNSLMHYPRMAFTGDMKKNSVVPKDPKFLNVIGQRYYFSDCDIAKINKLYKCGGNYKTTC